MSRQGIISLIVLMFFTIGCTKDEGIKENPISIGGLNDYSKALDLINSQITEGELLDSIRLYKNNNQMVIFEIMG